MQNFNEIFSKILSVYQSTGSMEKAIEAADLTPEQRERVDRAFALLDSFDESFKSLCQAKEEGTSTKNWLGNNIIEAATAKSLGPEKIEEVFELLDSESEKIKESRYQSGE